MGKLYPVAYVDFPEFRMASNVCIQKSKKKTKEMKKKLWVCGSQIQQKIYSMLLKKSKAVAFFKGHFKFQCKTIDAGLDMVVLLEQRSTRCRRERVTP